MNIPQLRFAESRRQILLLFVVMFSLSLLLSFSLNLNSAEALSGADFKAGRIIDNSVFYNSNTMSATQIQNFLNSKVPVCDTNHAKTSSSNDSGPPYTCLKDYRQNTTNIAPESELCGGYTGASNESAATIIYKVAKSCGINPQVLLVMLQKEQSLITDDWPWEIQYQKAMGAFCPDTAPCDPQYAGFFYQVYYGAHRFKVYAANPDSFNYRAGRNNKIYYHPDLARCGSSTVYIENQATANLYIYTPYQPNQAALDDLYGSGDNVSGGAYCSSFGNRNFWRMFNDWFGSTLGSLVRTTTSASLYYTDGSRRHAVPSMIIANQYGLGLNDVRYVTQQELDAIPVASTPFTNKLGTLVKSSSDSDDDGSTVYLVSGGNKFTIASMGVLTSFGYEAGDISYVSLETINRLYPAPKQLSTLVKGASATIYKIESGKRRVIFELSKLDEINTSNNISTLSDFTLGQFAYGTPLVDGDYIIKASRAIRVYNDASYFSVASMGVYGCWNMSNMKTFSVSSFEITNGSSQGNLSCISEDSAGAGFIMSGSKRLELPTGHGLATTTPTDTLINRLPSEPIKDVVKGSSSSSLAILENGKKRLLPNMTVFNDLGYTSSSISHIPGVAFSSIPTGALKLSIGTLIKASDGTVSVIGSNVSRLIITSATRFNDFAYSWGSLVPVNQLTEDAYPSAGNLPNILKTNASAFIVDGGTKYLVDPSIDIHLGIDRSSLILVDEKLVSKATQNSMTRFIKSSSSSTVYYMENGQKRAVSSWSKLVSLGGNGNVRTLSQALVSSFPNGATI
jgi:hypothetical protein